MVNCWYEGVAIKRLWPCSSSFLTDIPVKVPVLPFDTLSCIAVSNFPITPGKDTFPLIPTVTFCVPVPDVVVELSSKVNVTSFPFRSVIFMFLPPTLGSSMNRLVESLDLSKNAHGSDLLEAS